MRIAGIAASFPSRIVTNEEILDMIKRYSEPCFQGDLRKSLRRVRYHLRYSGIKTRRWLAPDEKPIQLLSDAVLKALAEADCKLGDIDLVIYVSGDGRFKEPANAYMLANALGMAGAQCFDIRDACMGWSRALQLVYHLFRGDGSYSRVLIVNAECNMQVGGVCFPGVFRIRNLEEIDWKFPAYTIGEVAAATVLARDHAQEWDFHFASKPDLADLCTVPEPGYESYCILGLDADSEKHQTTRIGRNGVNQFTSFGSNLFAEFAKQGPDVFRKLCCPLEEIRMVFPHTASKKLWEDTGKEVGSPPVYYVYPDYGNLVSASVPAGIDLARGEGAIKRGDRLVGWVGSAGMSFAAYSFIY